MAKTKKRRLKKSVKITIAVLFVILISTIVYASFKVGAFDKPTPEEGKIKDIVVQDSKLDFEDEGEFKYSEETLKFTVLDVGQGQSIFIDYGNFECLIDAGPVAAGEGVSKKIKPYVDGDIELAIATHSDEDHIGGFSQVFRDYTVNKTIYGNLGETKAAKIFEKEARAEGEFAEDSDMIIELGPNAQLTIFDVEDDNKENINANSVITLISFGETNFFASGDATKEVERQLRGKLPEVDVVVAGHHGSSDCNSLIDILNPQYFVISCGKGNEYGHPHKEVIEAVRQTRADILGTWINGDITFESDGISVNYKVEKADILTEEELGY